MTTQAEKIAVENSKKNEGKLPSPELAYSQIIEQSRDYATDGSLLFKWNGKIWQPIDPVDSEREAFRWLGAHPDYFSKATPKLAASCALAAVINARKLPAPASFSDADHVVLPLKNGYLHVQHDGSIALKPHEKTFGLTYLVNWALPVNL
jgi:hypothetical protein